MKATSSIYLVLCTVALFFSGCGLGGFVPVSNTSSPSGPNSPSTQRIFGVAAEGLIANGTVSIYDINSKGKIVGLLKTTTTDTFGNYSAGVNITGSAVLVKASGTYTDEATGNALSIDANSPLRAATDRISNVMNIAVTPLTELAVRHAENLGNSNVLTLNALTSSNIATANALVSSVFKMDIVTTQPEPLTLAAFSDTGMSQSQKDYCLVLAAISEMTHMYYNDSLANAVTAMSSDIANGGMLSSATAANLKSALIAFLASSQNQTGLADIYLTNLVNAGGSVKTVKLLTNGTLASGQTICGVNLTLQLPANATARADFTSTVYPPLQGVVTTSGVTPSGTILVARYIQIVGSNPATMVIALAHQTGFTIGEFATVLCDIPAGLTVQASDFKLTAFEAVDANGAVIPNVTGVIQ